MEKIFPTNLPRILNGLRFCGVGSKVTRTIYKFPDTYWIITRVKLTQNQDRGTVFGRLVWRGRPKEKDSRINPRLKKQWKLVDLPDYSTFKATEEDILKLIPTNTERTC